MTCLLAAAEGLFDAIPLERMAGAAAAVVNAGDTTQEAQDIDKAHRSKVSGARRCCVLPVQHSARWNDGNPRGSIAPH